MPATFTPCGPDERALLKELIDEYRRDLLTADARITLLFAWSEDDKPAMRHKGQRVLGRAQVNSLQDRAEGKGDATITLDGESWKARSPMRRKALMHHELKHIGCVEGKRDALDRPKLRSRHADWENDGFDEIAKLYGDDAPEVRWLRTVEERIAQKDLPFGEGDEREDAGPAPSPSPSLADDGWKTLPVSALHLPPGVAAKLEESGIATLGQLRAWTAPRPDGLGRRYDQIRGIGPEKALLVADAFGDFLGTWGGGEGEAGEPSTLPFDPGDSGDSPGSSGFNEAERAAWDAVEVGGTDGG